MRVYDFDRVKSYKGKLVHETQPSMYGGWYTEVKYISETGSVSLFAVGHSDSTKKSLVDAVKLLCEPLSLADVDRDEYRALYDISVRNGEINIKPR